MGKPELIIAAAEGQIGSPYVYGTWGQKCTVALRKRYANYNPNQREITYKRCQQLRPSRPVGSCAGCPYEGRLAFDCRGFSHWCLSQVGIDITGGYVGRQWTDKNWDEKGDIALMPDLVCCVFIRKADGGWSHTGLHVGGGRIIHCSGEVKRDTVGGSRSWTHYAIPKGLYTADEIAAARKEKPIMRTMKQGARGEDVRQLQEALNALGYICGQADGIFGAATEKAVRAFQTAEGIAADGIAGPVTLTLLAARGAAPSQPELPEDDDRHDTPVSPVGLTYADALAVRDALRKALGIIERAME